jgi:menaquinone-dependent protoporphyrinogen oxidase
VRILVAYSSLHGDTRGLAAHIASTLVRRGMDVTVARADAVERIGAYDAFVIGGAACRSHWLNEAARFVRLHWMLLADRPVWLFSTGPMLPGMLGGGEPGDHSPVPREFSEFARTIGPRDARVFAGAIHPGGASVGRAARLMAWVGRVIPPVRPAQRIELADQPAIEAWAEGIAHDLAVIGA